MNKTESRSLVQVVECRAAGEGASNTVAGYAAIFGSVATIGDYFKEVIAPGAFAQTLRDGDARAYFNHDRGRVLGRVSAGTLRLAEDEKGLSVEIDLPDTTDGKDVKTLISRGDVNGMSFRFEVVKEEWDFMQDPPLRTIYALNLGEVSVVSEPAYDDTSIALRSRDAAAEAAGKAKEHPAKRRIDLRARQMEHKFRGI